MTKPTKDLSAISVLHLEDNENDHVLVKELFASEGLRCDIVLAKSREQFEAALRKHRFDIIISDFTLPSYDGSKALILARQLQSDVPFIFFSGTIGEETAVDSLKTGATDFVIKERPGRLVAAVRRALQEVDAQKGRHEAEEALRRTEERFRLIARATNDVLWERDFRTEKIWVGENFESAFGHDPNAVGFTPEVWEALMHPEDRERVRSSVASIIAIGGRVWWSEFRLKRADGDYAHVFSRAFVTYDEKQTPIRMVGATIDVTERKRAENKIREQAELLDKAGDAIIVCDLDNQIVYWNRSAEKIYGWSADEAVGQKMDALLKSANKKETDEIESSLFERGEWIGQMTHQSKDNHPVVVASRWTLVRDEEGEPKSKLVFNTDVTEVKQLEEQLLRAQRLESLGALVSGIAHDLNNSLVPVLMGVGFLKTMEPLPEKAAEILDAMNASALRGADMIKSVLAFARGTQSEKKLLLVDHVVREMSRIIKDTFPRAMHCEVEIAPDCWAVSGVATQLHQVLMNLCVNARDAMPDGGTIKLSAKNTKLSKAEAAKIPEGRAGDFVCLSVSDSGVGIPPEQIAKIFQPFYTTKPAGKGTGLGLSSSLMIVKNHGGFMQVLSAPEKGSEFKVYLPAVDAKTVKTETPESSISLPPGNGETVLIVDDENAVLAIVKTTLESFDYRVLTATNGAEAVARLSEPGTPVQLIVTDATVQLMDGTPLIKALRKKKPDVKMILVQGPDQTDITDTATRYRSDAVIQKPFTVDKLVTAVHQVFAKRPG